MISQIRWRTLFFPIQLYWLGVWFGRNRLSFFNLRSGGSLFWTNPSKNNEHRNDSSRVSINCCCFLRNRVNGVFRNLSEQYTRMLWSWLKYRRAKRLHFTTVVAETQKLFFTKRSKNMGDIINIIVYVHLRDICIMRNWLSSLLGLDFFQLFNIRFSTTSTISLNFNSYSSVFDLQFCNSSTLLRRPLKPFRLCSLSVPHFF